METDCNWSSTRKRDEKNKYLFQTSAMKDWERKNQPLKNPKRYLIQQEITSCPKEAVTASVGMLLLQQTGTVTLSLSGDSPMWPLQGTAQPLSLKFQCLAEQSPALSGSGTATQVLSSKGSSPLPVEVEALDPFAGLAVARLVPQSQQPGCWGAPLPAVATSVT